MTKDLKDLVPAQEKLEWVTPKISQLVAGETEGKALTYPWERGSKGNPLTASIHQQFGS